jgi:hypothetical protein
MSEGKYKFWRKSSYSNASGNCVEVTSADRLVAVRDTKQGDRSPILEFTEVAWQRVLSVTDNDNQNL